MKNSLLLIAPILSRSGYGDHARDILRSLLKIDKYDIKIIPINWGITPNNYIPEDLKSELNNLLIHSITNQPDICVQITIPNEFKRIGKYNIGITAGIETTHVSAKWLENINQMDLVLVPSMHSKNTIVYTQYQSQDNHVLVCQKPVEVLFEGVDTKVFYKKDYCSKTIRDLLNNIDNKFLYLFVGQWMINNADRKNVSLLIEKFLETFSIGMFQSVSESEKPGLVLKVGINFGKVEMNNFNKKIKQIKNKILKKLGNKIKFPNIYIITGEFDENQMNDLYNHEKIKSMISLTKGEGFGRPLLEFSTTGKPIITTAWSGQLDFLDIEHSILLPGTLEFVEKNAVWDDIIIKESKWFNVDETKISPALINCMLNYQYFLEKSNNLAKINSEKFSLHNMTKKLDEILTQYIPDIPVFEEIELPELLSIDEVESE